MGTQQAAPSEGAPAWTERASPLLDDYQDVALSSADWSALRERAEVTTFSDHVAEEDAAADRLRDFDVAIAMCERTPFPNCCPRGIRCGQHAEPG